MTTRRNTDHVVLNYAVEPPVFLCRHCGGTEPTRLPSSVDALVLRSRAFTLEHVRCGEPPARREGEGEEGA